MPDEVAADTAIEKLLDTGDGGGGGELRVNCYVAESGPSLNTDYIEWLWRRGRVERIEDLSKRTNMQGKRGTKLRRNRRRAYSFFSRAIL